MGYWYDDWVAWRPLHPAAAADAAKP